MCKPLQIIEHLPLSGFKVKLESEGQNCRKTKARLKLFEYFFEFMLPL